MRSQSPVALEPGTYPVVLEPAAVATLAGFLAYVGFGGRGYIEDRSCFSGKAEQQVAAPSISIWDDGTDPRTLGAAFDFEGVPRQRVDLIKDGVFKDARLRPAHRQAGRAGPPPATACPRPTPRGRSR